MSGLDQVCSELSKMNLSVKFHENHCPGILIAPPGCTASWRTRLPGSHKMAFSARPIQPNEKIHVRVMENSIVTENGSDALRKATFGFTSYNPAKLRTVAGQIELYNEIDIKSCMVTEILKKGAVYTLWLDSDGRLKRTSDVNNIKPGLIHDDPEVTPDLPMWFFVKARGNVTLKLIESEVLYMVAGENGFGGNYPITYIYSDLANAFAHIMQNSNKQQQLQLQQSSPSSTNSLKYIENGPAMQINDENATGVSTTTTTAIG